MLLVHFSILSSVLSGADTFLCSRASFVRRCLALSKYTLSQGAAVRSDGYLALETAVDLRHVVSSRLVVLILDDEDGVGHEPGDVHAEVLEVLLRFLVQDPVGADYYWQGALPVGINLTFIIGIEGPGLHHANVNRLVAVGQEDVRLLACLACSTQVFCSWITVYFLRETRWSYSQHTIASWRITLYRCVCLQLSMWSSLIFVPQRVQLELRSQSAPQRPRPEITCTY